ncbi:hypothetical protein MCNS_19250 [Mycobacterium conspicuum]|uniref:Uncharacterized protein n=1 Tax=Mycobacterium conspicuum TaxID=44010 RepID=A0A1X1TMT0_9MYCO|nr:hypothetical protein AWC00_05465 [Mycobacterium conspicuum]BBZ38862.1 hypothetical protein MCNS_19250 [Mycobacterium conspicuum]
MVWHGIGVRGPNPAEIDAVRTLLASMHRIAAADGDESALAIERVTARTWLRSFDHAEVESRREAVMIHNRQQLGSSPAARAHGSQLGFHPLRIRRAVRFACSEPQRLVQFVQLDQHERLASDFASASHAEGRWFDPSRDHFETVQVRCAFL